MEKEKPIDPVNYYESLIVAYEREFKKWENRVTAILKRYRDEQRATVDRDQTKFNILWSNVQTLVPACYSRLPQPDVTRRFQDSDPAGRVAALLLERALTFETDHYPDYRATMKQSVMDRFLGGRGTSWARYEPHFKPGEDIPPDGLQVTEDAEAEAEEEVAEQIDYECAPTDYVHWKDFGHSIARTWEEVQVVWRRVFMTRTACVERFGEELGNKIPLDQKPDDKKSAGTDSASDNDKQFRAVVYEIWDKEGSKALWFSRSLKEMLDERPDPLKLAEFFPCPRPLYATMTNETLVPVPDFALYQDQARELDILADRIDGLVKMLQVKGCYDASTPELARLFTEGANGTLIPVKNYAAFAERKGLNGSIDVVDLKPIYEAIKVCFESAREIMNFVYQITGISDIVRGQSEASETLGAQQLKVNFVGLRLGEMKHDVARYATDLLQLKAQIICSKFSPQTIATMASAEQLADADKQYIVPALALLIGEKRMQDPAADAPNPLRAFRIEVNADSLVQLDEEAEKTSAQELLVVLGKFSEAAAQVAMAAPQMVPVYMEVLKWALRKFKVGRTLEGTVDAALEQMKQAQQQKMMQPSPPDPKVEAEKVKAQAVAQKAQSDVQVAQQKGHIALVTAKTKGDIAIGQAQQQAQIDQQHMQMEQQHDQAQLGIEGQRLQMEGQRMVMDEQHQRRAGDMKNEQQKAQHAQKMKQATATSKGKE